ncbi:MAG: PDZ domain-containing protein [Kofleriaceae bacterium]
MRFAWSVASVLLLGSAAFAEEAAAPPAAPAAAAPSPARAAKKLPLRVVRVLADTQQALLFDRSKSTHVLVEVGTQIDGFAVTDIDDDTVTLTAEGGQQIVLAGPDPSWRGHEHHAAQQPAKAIVQAPEDPYAAATPVDPYGPYGDDSAMPATAPITAGQGGVRTAEAPASAPTTGTAGTAGSGGVRTAEAPGAPANVTVEAAIPSSTIPTAATAAFTPTAPTLPPIISAAAPVAAPVAAPSAEPAAPIDTSSSAAWSTTPVDPTTAALVGAMTDPKPAKATSSQAKADKVIPSVSATGTPAGAETSLPAAASAPGETVTVLAKADVTAALGNFGALATAVRGSFGAGGAHLDAVAPDSLFAKAGLQAGDTITAINHRPLRSLDDAATLYARAGSMTAATIQVLRAGKPLSLRLSIQ